MRIESFRDLLNWTSGYHRHLSHCLAHSAKHHSDENLLGRSHPPQMQQLLVEIHDLEKSEAQQMMQGANRLEDI